jgi:hypothetical protein
LSLISDLSTFFKPPFLNPSIELSKAFGLGAAGALFGPEGGGGGGPPFGPGGGGGGPPLAGGLGGGFDILSRLERSKLAGARKRCCAPSACECARLAAFHWPPDGSPLRPSATPLAAFCQLNSAYGTGLIVQ